MWSPETMNEETSIQPDWKEVNYNHALKMQALVLLQKLTALVEIIITMAEEEKKKK
jgi:hypothetical protein